MNSCSICLENLEESSSEITLGCSHKYHLNCIHTNITQGTTPSKCPLCRKNIKMKDSLIKLSEEGANKKQEIDKQIKEMTDRLRPKIRILIFESFVIEGFEDFDYQNITVDFLSNVN